MSRKNRIVLFAAGLSLIIAASALAMGAGKVLFCENEVLAVNLAKLSNNDAADLPGLNGMQPTVYFREAVLHKICYFVEAAGWRPVRILYRGPAKGSFSVAESVVTPAAGGRPLEGFVLTRDEVPAPKGVNSK